jgi:D-arabinose 5-phosphate isomerase GutQ
VIGIAASGTTPYVVGALKHCREHGIATGCIVCNQGSPLAQHADYPVEVVVGPEFVNWKHQDEIRHRSKACPEHDQHGCYDQPRQSERK